jgi:GNAT superfamily N-acetyltransferase
MEAPYVIEPLSDRHDRAAFSCGVESLDRYLHRQAKQDLRRYVAAVFVACPAATSTVAGYYTLSASSIVSTDLPPEVIKRLPRYPAQPAVLLGRLAVDQQYRGQGLGALLVASALRRSLRLHTEIGAMAVIVDAKDDAARRFYEHHDFQPFPEHPLRLYYLMQTIAGLFPDE